LRTLREGIMCELRQLDDDESLIEAASRAALNTERFEADLRSPTSEEAFEADLAEVRDPPPEAHDAEATHRDRKGHEIHSFPSALFIGADTRRGAWGCAPVDVAKMRDAAPKAGAKPVN